MKFEPAVKTIKPKPVNPQKPGRQPAYTIAGECFFSKKALGARVVWIAEKNKYDKLKGEEGVFLRDFLNLHPNATQKIGCGVAFISVAPNTRTIDSWTLIITRTDGATVDFSYRECLWPKNGKLKAIDAFRDEIFDQCQGFIRTHIAVHGNPTNSKLVTHHDPSFNNLLKSFVNDLPLLIELEDLETYEPGYTETSCGESALVDRSIAEAWRAYHRMHARLHAVTEEEHKKINREMAMLEGR